MHDTLRGFSLSEASIRLQSKNSSPATGIPVLGCEINKRCDKANSGFSASG